MVVVEVMVSVQDCQYPCRFRQVAITLLQRELDIVTYPW